RRSRRDGQCLRRRDHNADPEEIRQSCPKQLIRNPLENGGAPAVRVARRIIICLVSNSDGLRSALLLAVWVYSHGEPPAIALRCRGHTVWTNAKNSNT